MAKWQDPRTPVSVTYVGKYKVTIFDQALYDAELLKYPPDETTGCVLDRLTDNKKPTFAKKKAAFGFAEKLDSPFGGLF